MSPTPRVVPGSLLVEVGGSGIRVALSGPDGPTDRRRSPLSWSGHSPQMSDVLDVVARAGADAFGGSPRHVVVAWPGPISPDGRALASPTVSGGAESVDIAGELSRRLDGAEVHVVNDLTAAGLQLCAEGMRDFAVVTVGSGVGHKVFVAGEPVVGPGGRGGELGHLVVDRSETAPVCDCGGRGHLGAIASGRAIVAAVGALWETRGRGDESADQLSEQVAAAYRDGEQDVVALVDDRARVLGWGLATLHTGVGVEAFVLMGGFAHRAGERFRAQVAHGAADSCWDLGLDWDVAVVIASPEDSPGLDGAWLLARELGWS